jgi:hypothetical protein
MVTHRLADHALRAFKRRLLVKRGEDQTGPRSLGLLGQLGLSGLVGRQGARRCKDQGRCKRSTKTMMDHGEGTPG